MDVFAYPLISAFNHMAEISEEAEKSLSPAATAYAGARKEMTAMRADVRDLPAAYEFVVDMPGMSCRDIKVQLEDGRVLVVSGERKREEEEEDVKYLRIERRMGKFSRRFRLRKKVKPEAVSAKCQDGVLIVTVEKPSPPPEKKKSPKNIEVKAG